MRKCPRCGYQINSGEKFCPHCGLDLERHYASGPKNKAKTYLIYVIIFFSFITIPALYSRFLGGIGNNFNSNNQAEKSELPELVDATPSVITAQFTTLADYNKQYTNVSSYIKNIEKYETDLSAKGNFVFDKAYQIQVLDNYNVLYHFRYTTKVNDNLSIVINKQFDRAHSYNKETITVRKNNVTDFQSLMFNEEELNTAYTFIDDRSVTDKLMKDFSTRESEFAKKKDKLGHYGLGNYEDQSSFVAYRQGKIYYSELEYGHEAKDYID